MLNIIKKKIVRIDDFMKNLSPISFMLTIFICSYIVFIPFSYILDTSNMGGVSSINSGSFLETIVYVSIIAPIIETLIFQSLVIELLEKIKILNEKKYIIVIISAILFGISHSYSYIYIFYAGIIGLFLGYAYIVYQKKHFSPFLMVMIIHSLRNTIVAVGNVLLF